MKKCLECSKTIVYLPSEKRKYCSRECLGVANGRRLNTCVEKNCEVCGEVFSVQRSRYKLRVSCSRKCKDKVHGAKIRGEKNRLWKKVKKVSNQKLYKFLNINGKRIAEHRHLMELHLGRKLKSEELVHHIDKDPTNNDIRNLQIVSRSEHNIIHNTFGCA